EMTRGFEKHKLIGLRVTFSGDGDGGWFLAKSVRSSNAEALDSPYLLVLFTGTSQSRQQGDDENATNPPPVPPTPQAPHTISTIKLPIMKKAEYTNGQIRVLPPKTAEEILAREKERKARTTLLMAIPEDHLAKFHKITDAKEMWEAIKSRFGRTDESKKMQKYILKQQFEGFSVSNSEGLHKGYDRFQSLLSQLEIHGAGVSTEDANQKFLRSLPSSWSQVSLIMRIKPGVDTLSFDDLYSNLRVFGSDVKRSTASSSSTQNVAFVSSDSTNSSNEASTAYGISTSSSNNSQKEGSLMNSCTLYLLINPMLHNWIMRILNRNQLDLTRPKLSVSIATIQDTLLESADQKEIKKVEGEMQEILDTKQETMGEDLENKMNIKLWSLLMEKVLIGLVMLKMT
nr:ribonuclease H-like domain-containing protein [Tanacetum cinerariifolium]